MISYNSAIDIISSVFSDIRQQTAKQDIINSTGKIVAEDIYSDIDLPPFDNSAMDGFAVKFNPNIRNWSITGELSAGNYSPVSITEVTAVQIMTGAKLPENADTVIPVEDVILREGAVILNRGAKYTFGMNTRKKGEDLESDKLAIKKNTLLKPQHIALAASCGRSELNIYRDLKIGVLATGDELIEVTSVPQEDKVRVSNLYSILSAVHELGHIPVNLGIARDDKEEIRNKIISALNSDIDILVTTGGVSVGKYDHVKDILIDSGVEIKFHNINIKPGKPVLFGVYNNGNKRLPVFGLPGNPVSSLVTFNLFIKDSILKMYDQGGLQQINASLLESIHKEDDKRHFLRGLLTKDNLGKFNVSVVGKQSSGNLAQMSRANCLIVVEENKINPQKGEDIECIMM